MERINGLRELAAQAAPLVPAVVQKQQQRFLERWTEAMQAAGNTTGATVTAEAARERALNEAAAFAIRIDVAEELSRLTAHLEEIARLLKAGGEIGKRLDFLIQELHREANTLGSKSAALELTGISVGDEGDDRADARAGAEHRVGSRVVPGESFPMVASGPFRERKAARDPQRAASLQVQDSSNSRMT